MAWFLQAVASQAQVSPAMSGASLVVSLPFPGVVACEADCQSSKTPSVKLFAPSRTTPVFHVINGEHFSGAEWVQDLLACYLRTRGSDVA